MIELVTTVPLFPWKCMVCGEKGDENTNRDFFISLGIDTEWDGRIYICNLCLDSVVEVSPNHCSRELLNEALEAQNVLVSNATAVQKKHELLKEELAKVGIDLDQLTERVIYGPDDRISDELVSVTTGIDFKPSPTESDSESGHALRKFSLG